MMLSFLFLTSFGLSPITSVWLAFHPSRQLCCILVLSSHIRHAWGTVRMQCSERRSACLCAAGEAGLAAKEARLTDREAAAGRTGGSGRRIVYSDADIERLLDRSALVAGTVDIRSVLQSCLP